jgi:hypothetical protein
MSGAHTQGCCHGDVGVYFEPSTAVSHHVSSFASFPCSDPYLDPEVITHFKGMPRTLGQREVQTLLRLNFLPCSA